MKTLRALVPVVVCVAVAACASRGDYMTAQTRISQQAAVIEAQEGQLFKLQGDLTRCQGTIDAQKAELERLRVTDEAYQQARARLEARIGELENTLKEAGTIGVSIEQLPGGGYQFVVTGEVLFGFAKEELTEAGRKTLRDIATALNKGDWPIEVVGHTDNVPVKKPETLKKYPRGNIELSTARALAVAEFLIKSGGVSASRIVCVGCGEHHPIADNRTDEGRRKNRRVEIRVPRTEK
jgi:flagellar motor protein MotB